MAELTVTGHILVHCMDVALTIDCLSGKAFSTFFTLVSLPYFHSPLSHLSQSTAFILCHHAYSPSCCLFLLLPFLLPSPSGLYTQIMRPHSFISYSVSSMMHQTQSCLIQFLQLLFQITAPKCYIFLLMLHKKIHKQQDLNLSWVDSNSKMFILFFLAFLSPTQFNKYLKQWI